jgi:hypothetical protein
LWLHHAGGGDSRGTKPTRGVRTFSGIDGVVKKISGYLDSHRAAESAEGKQEIE